MILLSGPLFHVIGFPILPIVPITILFGILAIIISVSGTPRYIISGVDAITCRMWSGASILLDAEETLLYSGGGWYWQVFSGWLLVDGSDNAVFVPARPTNYTEWLGHAQASGLQIVEQRPVIQNGSTSALRTALRSLSNR